MTGQAPARVLSWMVRSEKPEILLHSSSINAPAHASPMARISPNSAFRTDMIADWLLSLCVVWNGDLGFLWSWGLGGGRLQSSEPSNMTEPVPLYKRIVLLCLASQLIFCDSIFVATRFGIFMRQSGYFFHRFIYVAILGYLGTAVLASAPDFRYGNTCFSYVI